MRNFTICTLSQILSGMFIQSKYIVQMYILHIYLTFFITTNDYSQTTVKNKRRLRYYGNLIALLVCFTAGITIYLDDYLS